MKSCEDISSFVTEEKEPPEDDIKGKLKSSEISDDFSKENDEKSALIPENKAPKPNEETSKLGSVSKQVYLGYIKGKEIRIYFFCILALRISYFFNFHFSWCHNMFRICTYFCYTCHECLLFFIW